jgi:molybdopterin converting factor small subunit
MNIKIRSTFAIGVTGGLRAKCRADEDIVFELKPGSRVADLLLTLDALGPVESFDDMMIHVFVNGTVRGFDHRLHDGDVIDLHIPVSGG